MLDVLIKKKRKKNALRNPESRLPHRARPWQVEITWPLRQSRVRPSEVLLRVTRGAGIGGGERAAPPRCTAASAARRGRRGGDPSRAIATARLHSPVGRRRARTCPVTRRARVRARTQSRLVDQRNEKDRRTYIYTGAREIPGDPVIRASSGQCIGAWWSAGNVSPSSDQPLKSASRSRSIAILVAWEGSALRDLHGRDDGRWKGKPAGS